MSFDGRHERSERVAAPHPGPLPALSKFAATLAMRGRGEPTAIAAEHQGEKIFEITSARVGAPEEAAGSGLVRIALISSS